MILFLQTTTEKALKANEGLKNTENTLNNSNMFQDIINLLDVIIWPIAMVFALYMFKEHIGRIIKSLGSIKASATGFELNFIDNKLDAAAKFIGMGSSEVLPKQSEVIIPKEGSRIIPKGDHTIIPKDDNSIIPNDRNEIAQKDEVYTSPKQSRADSPYQELIELQDAISVKLITIAKQNGIINNYTSNFALTNDLESRNILNSHTAQKLKMLIELNTIGLNSPKTTHNQVSQMKKLFNNIIF